MTGFLDLRGIEKSFDGQRVLDAVDLATEQGEFFTLLGPSGCGKTTLLRIIGGFEQADAGAVCLRGRELGSSPPERRPFNMVFQSYALFPHMTVEANVGYGLRTAGVARAEAARRVRSMLELVHLDRFAGRSVRELSGGQQQRVALARALVNEPEVLLLDEPLGALDLQLRKRLQEELRAIQTRLATTFIYVTHDQEEALTMSRRIGVMSEGRLIQVGSPREVYEHPQTRFVAEFVGAANVLACQVVDVGQEAVIAVRFADGAEAELQNPHGLRLEQGGDALAMIRPECLELTADPAHLRGIVRESLFIGSHLRHDVEVESGELVRVLGSSDRAAGPGERVSLRIVPGKGIVMAADGAARPVASAQARPLTALEQREVA